MENIGQTGKEKERLNLMGYSWVMCGVTLQRKMFTGVHSLGKHKLKGTFKFTNDGTTDTVPESCLHFKIYSLAEST